MEFSFNINRLLPDKITMVASEFLSTSFYGKVNPHKKEHYQNLENVINELGLRSAKAQGLPGSITNLHKSLLSGHHIYVLRDSELNNGQGGVIGFIKVGKKRLFLLDHHGNQNEMYPLCVLDFYIHESHQRRGCGLALFKHMLQRECFEPRHMAIDRPSHKFLSFLKKHFNMWERIHQVNNFVIYEGFFDDRSDVIRTSVSNERFEKSRVRPLSRAVSDDVIRRHREPGASMNQRNWRPASGFMITNTGDYQNLYNKSNRRRRWNMDGTLQPSTNHASALPNFYSRFSHENTYTSNRKPPSGGQQKIINHHICVAPDETANTNPPIDEVPVVEPSSIPNLKHQTPQQETRNEGNLPIPQVKSASSALDSRSHTYNKPADMLKELKEKDEQILQEHSAVNSPSRYQRSWGGRNGHTSWNIFGVPTAKQWALR